jgi:hypothetical protein
VLCTFFLFFEAVVQCQKALMRHEREEKREREEGERNANEGRAVMMRKINQ